MSKSFTVGGEAKRDCIRMHYEPLYPGIGRSFSPWKRDIMFQKGQLTRNGEWFEALWLQGDSNQLQRLSRQRIRRENRNRKMSSRRHGRFMYSYMSEYQGKGTGSVVLLKDACRAEDLPSERTGAEALPEDRADRVRAIAEAFPISITMKHRACNANTHRRERASLPETETDR